jgi:hypothetical protein
MYSSTLPQPPDDLKDCCDPFMITSLVKAMHRALEQAAIPDVTTPAEVLSALFTLLRHTLQVMMAMQGPEEQDYNRRQVGQALTDLLMEFGIKVH